MSFGRIGYAQVRNIEDILEIVKHGDAIHPNSESHNAAVTRNQCFKRIS
jgi:hypothetical protein